MKVTPYPKEEENVFAHNLSYFLLAQCPTLLNIFEKIEKLLLSFMN